MSANTSTTRATSTAQPPLPSARENTALIVIDVQTGVMAESWNAAEVIGTISHLVDRARANGTPVIWVRHTSQELPTESSQWQIVDALSPADGEAIVEKTHGNTFEDTNFDDVLTTKDIGHLVVTGAQSDACIRSTIHGGFARGYDVTLVSDAHTTEDLSEWGAPPPEKVVSHTNLYWEFETGPGRTARVQESAEVDFVAPRSDS
ncbi:isochorismatase family protein [Brevibacterium aurantiacum]|uniref:Isochorismatase n=1 Tax=Brevibacterium aurantiacum TaxID=273384 RepID=A0A2A3ZBG1_BREAU|nr:isochorismatase family protein [Brevibacterium aurantiacum]MDN5585449.1 isochorismatase family protein [Brevibacterium sp.]PCC20413.1 isochorismatase [Brevibacterium aurantiacum]PCC48879.1 isochorismatase [Brevibacterium aurantiacum]RCS94005.1 isochorismatase family protein [Brevibacterium aurantiacum]SMX96722.1 Nicotinamidase-related amidase [Brevibacterium aurantiacum]